MHIFVCCIRYLFSIRRTEPCINISSITFALVNAILVLSEEVHCSLKSQNRLITIRIKVHASITAANKP